MTEPFIINARIEGATLSTEDHGMLIGMLDLKLQGGCGQAFQHTLGRIGPSLVPGPNYAGQWIIRVLKVAGVHRFRDLPGKIIRVQHDQQRLIEAIGHPLDDVWFFPRVEFPQLELLAKEPDETSAAPIPSPLGASG